MSEKTETVALTEKDLEWLRGYQSELNSLGHAGQHEKCWSCAYAKSAEVLLKSREKTPELK